MLEKSTETWKTLMKGSSRGDWYIRSRDQLDEGFGGASKDWSTGYFIWTAAGMRIALG